MEYLYDQTGKDLSMPDPTTLARELQLNPDITAEELDEGIGDDLPDSLVPTLVSFYHG